MSFPNMIVLQENPNSGTSRVIQAKNLEEAVEKLAEVYSEVRASQDQNSEEQIQVFDIAEVLVYFTHYHDLRYLQHRTLDNPETPTMEVYTKEKLLGSFVDIMDERSREPIYLEEDDDENDTTMDIQ